jgi:hypothetical protein
MHSADHPEPAVESTRAAPIAHRHLAAPLLGAAGLLASGAATVYFLAFLSGAGPVPSIDGDPSAGAGAPVAVAVLVDVGLVLLFGLQHTLLLAASLTAYIAIGVRHEERDLVAWFGVEYRRYRRRTGALLPRLVRPGAP